MYRFHFKREKRLHMLIQVKTSERDSLVHVIDSKEERMLKIQKSIRGESLFSYLPTEVIVFERNKRNDSELNSTMMSVSIQPIRNTNLPIIKIEKEKK